MSAPRPGIARRLAASPLTHFAAAGALLLAVHSALERTPDDAPAPARRAPIVISAAQARTLETDFAGRWGRPPQPAERTALLAQAAQEEMLYREARVLALGFEDASVRRRLVEMMRVLGEQRGRAEDELAREALALGLDDDVVIRRLLAEKMRLVLQRDPAGVAIRDEELTAILERDRAQFTQPATVTLRQIFLSTDARGHDAAARSATMLLAALRAGSLSPEDAVASSDALPIAGILRSHSRQQIQARFGKPFADQVFALEPATWSGPIESPFGLHLVQVAEQRPEHLPALDEVRPALIEALRRERAQANLARGLARVRSLYEVHVAAPGAQQNGPSEVLAAVTPR